MLQKIKKRIGQSTLEYAVLVVVIIGALIAMQGYIRRAIQGRWGSASDDISDMQFDDTLSQITKVTNTVSNTTEITTHSGTNTFLRHAEVTNVQLNALFLDQTP